MNERIKELSLQALQLVADEHTNGDESRLNTDSYHVKDLIQEKFAELLVKECLKLCKEVESDLAGIYEDAERDATQIGARFCYEAILGEFGVEE